MSALTGRVLAGLAACVALVLIPAACGGQSATNGGVSQSQASNLAESYLSQNESDFVDASSCDCNEGWNLDHVQNNGAGWTAVYIPTLQNLGISQGDTLCIDITESGDSVSFVTPYSC